ncbi:MAG: hypothetical protein KDJ80_08455 [Nitratireductor sp.]|nr:hypothetical protein [Nitratireductor sp.]
MAPSGAARKGGRTGRKAGARSTPAASTPAASTSAASTSAARDGAKPLAIRRFVAQDAENLRRLMRQHHDKTVFGHLPFSDAKFDRHVESILQFPPHMAALVAERTDPEGNSSLAGFAWATAGTYALSDEGVMATCHVIAVDGDTLGPVLRARVFLSLLKAIKAWSKTRNADHVLVHVTTGSRADGFDTTATHHLLKKVGATAIGGGYVV